MKANEAPEKLYVDVHDNLGDPFFYGFIEKQTDEDIEYTRTDSFIDKACEYLNNFYNNKTRSYLIGEDIEDFINYMKGE